MERTAGSTSSTEARERNTPSQVMIGRVVGAHGLRGQLRVQYFGDAPDPLLRITRVELAGEDGAGARPYEVAAVSPGRRGELRVALAGLRGRDAALELRGRFVFAAPEQLPPLPEGEYYGFELVGCRVEASDGRRLGTVRGIWETGASDVLVVEDEQGREQLIPAAAPLLREVDREGRRLVMELPPGLLEAE